ncbi:ABC transporter ATP-binding protein [Bacillus piscicola]|uniref:ABC transporter ATP-binding protein n=1 Tax=Bacillus piscicola TaxID=1632684 RepID=UPI001F08C132|nr:ABC transporter ATP-binding protein [Bacillus piscicola]
MITFHNIQKEFNDGTKAIQDFNLTINEGEMFVLIGPSGCGKTTTLKLLNRLIEPTSGRITIKRKDIQDWDLQKLRWNTGYVLQQIALFPTMTIAENISVVPEMKKWSKRKISSRVDELLHMTGLDPAVYRNRMPAELSGGEQQRVGVIRALAADPDIVLMDEPFSALDPISREQLQKDIHQLQADIKKTIVFVTHDIDEALQLGDRICLMDDGKIIQTGTPHELISRPVNQFVKEFIGNRDNEWNTPVSKIMNRESEYSAHVDNMAQASHKQYTPLYIFGDDREFLGRRQGEEVLSPEVTLHPDTPLDKAVHCFDKTDVEALPVIRDGQIIGVISYKDIVHFLKHAQHHLKETVS